MQMSRVGALFVTLVAAVNAASGDRTITRVVKLLQDMMHKSKADGDNERTLYGKYKCYCDTNEAEKKESISSLTTQIGLLESEIDGLQASSGVLSSECADLQADMATNKESREKAQAIRDEENAAWLALEADHTQAIEQMTQAIETLAEVGADQTSEDAAADHTQFMKGNSLVSLRKTVKQALIAASAFTNKKQVQKVESFLQAPFTGTYAAQSGEVVGIIKDMKDTFTSNLESARAAEAAALESHTAFMKNMLEAYAAMEALYEEKQEILGDNDQELSDKRTSLDAAETQKAADEEFLAQLLVMCAAKAKDYESRTLLRTNENAAIAEAISILNSDAAFSTFGKVSATSTGETSFFQTSQIKKHVPVAAMQVDAASQRVRVEKFLRKAAVGHEESRFLSKVMALLTAGNPFDVVLKEIQKMLALIVDEEKVDTEELAWCNKEREENNANLEIKKSEITTLEGTITTLKDTIDNPVTGLKFQISETEASLVTNSESQTTETADRKESNAAYTEDITNLVESDRLLKSAISVLEKYYSKILGSEAMLQASKQPTPPETWENDSYGGQSSKGTDAISMLKFILEETNKEEGVAHKDENDSQFLYEDSMKTLKDEERTLLETLASLQKTLAETEQELLEKEADLKSTIAAKEAIEAYLLKIKPGCDFITSNMELRTTNRGAETDALNQATDLIKGSPAYMTAEAEAFNETLGDCQGICNNAGQEHVTCKACLAKVTVPGYCAGHAGTEGC
jgi:hypothetical protein